MKKYIRSSKLIKHVDSNYGDTGEISSHSMLIYLRRELQNSTIFNDSNYQIKYKLKNDSYLSSDILTIVCSDSRNNNVACAQYLESKIASVKEVAENVMIDCGYEERLSNLNISVYEGMDGFRDDPSYIAVKIKYDSIS